MPKAKTTTQKPKPLTKTERLKAQLEKKRLKKVAKEAAHLYQMACHEAAHCVVAETLKRGTVKAHLTVDRREDKLNVQGEHWIEGAEAPSLPMLLSAVGWAGVLSLPFVEHNIRNLDDWHAVLNDSDKRDLVALASDDTERLAGALKGATVKRHAGPKDIEEANLYQDHAKSVLYAAWTLVKSRSKLRSMTQNLILSGATYPRYKGRDWEELVGADVIEAALAIKPTPIP